MFYFILSASFKDIDKSIDIEGDISEIKLKIKEAVSEIRTAINKRKHSEVNRIFNSIISDISRI